MPLFCIRRFQSITSAAPTSTFFGSQPRRAHVPPKGLESTTATCRPALRQRVATADAADPVPITTTSNFLIIYLSLRREISHPESVQENDLCDATRHRAPRGTPFPHLAASFSHESLACVVS